MKKYYGYCRVSTQSQDVEKQKHSLLNYGYENNISFEEIIEVVQSSRKSTKEREIDKLIDIANSGDVILITRLDRLGRNTREFLNIVEILKSRGITLHIIKENMIINPNKNDPMTNLFLILVSSFSQLERDWISERTIAGLEAAKASGKMLGKPIGAISNNTQFEEHKEKIYEYLKLGLSYEKIVKVIGVGSKSSLFSFVQHRRQYFKVS